jgi:hypothetical protein
MTLYGYFLEATLVRQQAAAYADVKSPWHSLPAPSTAYLSTLEKAVGDLNKSFRQCANTPLSNDIWADASTNGPDSCGNLGAFSKTGISPQSPLGLLSTPSPISGGWTPLDRIASVLPLDTTALVDWKASPYGQESWQTFTINNGYLSTIQMHFVTSDPRFNALGYSQEYIGPVSPESDQTHLVAVLPLNQAGGCGPYFTPAPSQNYFLTKPCASISIRDYIQELYNSNLYLPGRQAEVVLKTWGAFGQVCEWPVASINVEQAGFQIHFNPKRFTGADCAYGA